MAHTVSVGVDGSRASRTAAHWAAREALLRGLTLRLIHAGLRTPTGVVPPVDTALLEPPVRSLRATAVEIRSRYRELRVTTELITGDPAAVLPVVAAESELLVLGSQGYGLVAGVLTDSVAMSTVARAERPVVLVQATAHDMPVPEREVLVAVDVTHPSGTLLEFAFGIAARRGARLRAVHVWTPPAVLSYDPRRIALERIDEAERAGRELADALRPWRAGFPDVEVAEVSLPGRAVRELRRAASRSSLAVVGNRIRHASVGTRIGPVTHAVIQAAETVAVVPDEAVLPLRSGGQEGGPAPSRFGRLR